MTDKHQRRIRSLSWLFAFSLIAGSIVYVLGFREQAFLSGSDKVRFVGSLHLLWVQVLHFDFEVPEAIGKILASVLSWGAWFLISLGIFGGLLFLSACLRRLFSRRAEISS